MPSAPSARLAIAFLLFVCGLALWRGRWPERTAAAAFAAQQALYLATYDPSDLAHPQWIGFALDMAVLAVLAAVAIISDRAWAKSVAAVQMLATSTHLALALDLRIEAAAAFWMSAFCTTAMLILLLAGTIEVIWRERRSLSNEGA